MTRRTLPKDEIEKLFHIRDDYDGTIIPLYPVYDPDYDGEHYRDWDDDSAWYIWAATGDELERLGSVEILRELHVRRVIRRDEVPPEVADSPVY